jgi:hypothetical protein
MAGNQEGPVLIRLVVGLPVVGKILDPQVGEQVEQLEQVRQALESLIVTRSVGITNDDFITYIIEQLRGIGAVDCGDNDWRACFEEVGVDEFAEFVSNHLLTAFAIIALKARGHIIVTPNPIPTIMLVTNAGFVLLAKDVNASECFAIINMPAARRLLMARPCEFGIKF